MPLCLLLIGLSQISRGDDGGAIEPVDPQLGRAVDFYQDVYPILERKCLACHNQRNAESDLVLETSSALLQGGISGPAVVAGDPERSLFYRLVTRMDEPVMPPLPNPASAQPLTAREVGVIRQWILEGAPAGTRPATAGELAWQPVPEHIHSIYSLSLSPDERFVAAGRANRIVVYDLSNHAEIALTDPALLSLEYQGQRFYGPGTSHRDLVHSLRFSPDGRWLASAGYREVKLWERLPVETRLELATSNPGRVLAVSDDGEWAATLHEQGPLHLWNLTSGRLTGTIETGDTSLTAIDFSTSAGEILTADEAGVLRRWSIPGGELIAELYTALPVRTLLAGHDPARIYTGHEDGVIRCWTKPEPVETSSENETPAETAADNTSEESEAIANEPPPPAQPIQEFRGHGGPVTILRRVPGAEEILSGSTDGRAILWNLGNGNQVRQFNLGGAVISADISPDGAWIAAGGENQVARVWNRGNGQQRIEVKGDPRAERHVLALTDEQQIANSLVSLADSEKQAAAQDLTSREENLTKSNETLTAAETAVNEAMAKLEEEMGKAQAAAQSLENDPENEDLKKALADAEQAVNTATEGLTQAQSMLTSARRAVDLGQQGLENAQRRVEQAEQGHQQAQAHAQSVEQQLNEARTHAQMTLSPIHSVAFSADGRQLVTSGSDQILILWNAETGAPLEVIEQPPAGMFGLRFMPTGLLAGLSGNTLQVLDLRPTWRLAAVLGSRLDNSLDLSESPMLSRVLSLAFSPDGAILATGGGDPSRSGEILLWDLATRQVLRELTDPHSDTVFDLEFSRNGEYLASASADKFMKVFAVNNGELVRSFEGHTAHVLAVAWKADGSTLATGGADNVIKVWNFATGEQIRTITTHQKEVTDVDYIGVTDNIVSCSGGRDVRYHQASNGRFYREFGGNTDFVYAVEANRDERLVVAGGQDGTLRVWNGQNGQLIVSFPPPEPAGQESAVSLGE